MDRNAAIFLGALLGGLWLLFLWLGIVAWTYRDVRSRSRDLTAQVLAVFLVLMFFPGMNVPGLLLYLLLRPRETLEEAYARSLEQEALLAEVGEGALCGQCQQPVQKDFLFCPYCQAHLREPCRSCERLLSLYWSICPYCGTPRGPRAVSVPAQEVAPETRTAEPVAGTASSTAGRSRGRASSRSQGTESGTEEPAEGDAAGPQL